MKLVPLDPDTTVRLAEFIPDYVVRDGQIYARSSALENPAAHLIVESTKSGQSGRRMAAPNSGPRAERVFALHLRR